MPIPNPNFDLLTRAPSTVQGLGFHHFGLAVSDPDPATAFLRAIGYQIGQFVYDPLQNVHLTMCHHPHMPAVEIIYPGHGPGPLDRVLRPRDGLIYHLCYTAENVTDIIDDFDERGIRLLEISPPKPAILFGGQPVSFHMAEGIGLLEFIHQS